MALFQPINTQISAGCTVHRWVLVIYLLSNLTQPWKFLMHLLAVLSHLRPRFSYDYILDHYGHAQSRRGASARRGRAPLYGDNISSRRCAWATSVSLQSRLGAWNPKLD